MTRSTDLISIVRAIAAKDDFAVFSYAGYAYAILFHPYYPQVEGGLMVDNYYPAYQEVRNLRLRLEDETAHLDPKPVTYPYKGIALLTGRVKRLVNSLTAHPKYGSFFVMEMLRYEGVEAPEFPLLAEMRAAGVDPEAFLDLKHPDHAEAIAKQMDAIDIFTGIKSCDYKEAVAAGKVRVDRI